MNCAWCNPSDNGTDGICGACMLLYFNINPADIEDEIAAEKRAREASTLPHRTAHLHILEEREVVSATS